MGLGAHEYVFVDSGGIGGNIKRKANSLIYVFSGPAAVSSAEEAEIEAILHVLDVCSTSQFKEKRIVICSDSTNALEKVRGGLKSYLPLRGENFDLQKQLGTNIFLHYVPRDFNMDEDGLAKEGLNRPVLHSYWTCNQLEEGP